MADIPFWDLVSDEGYEGRLFPENPWDLVILGDEKLPGRQEVKATAANKVDIQKASGRDGGALIERGYNPAPFDIDVYLWTPEQWTEWQRIAPKLARKPGKLDVNDAKKKVATKAAVDVTSKAALPIVHPGLASLEIKSVIVFSVSSPDPTSTPGVRMIKLKCIHYVTPSPAKATRKAAGVKAPARDPRLDLGTTKNRPEAPSKTDGGPGGPPRTPTGGSH